MAASSSSTSLVTHHQISPDVFVSFRGQDVRHGFLSHLMKAFREKAIDAYVDDRLNKGDEVSPALLKAIEESQISLIIFSTNYASSKWCLDELVKIVECKEQIQQIIIPVFYQIEPSDVRHQTGNYGIPFAKHEKRYDIMTVQKWRTASKKAANISGYPLSNFKSEVEFIQEIVKCVVKYLDNDKIQGDYKNLVGIDRRLAKVEFLLCKGSKEVCTIGIWGIGGIGKTTIANALVRKLFSDYRGCCFMMNLREELEKHIIADVKKKLYSKLLQEDFSEIPMIPSYVTKRLQRKKVLILLDDIYELKDLKFLIDEEKDFFGPGSIIVVISRDKQILRYLAGDHIYEVEALNEDEAVQLLSLNAFKKENPKKEWIGLSKRVVGYTQGNPLALAVLGSSLFELKPIEWESLLGSLGKMPREGLQNVLRLSYDRLELDHQKIFLFLSCFFLYHFPYYIRILLDACGFSTPFAFRNLENKAFIKISNEVVDMHSLIREMGRKIVQEESFDEPGKRSHLWDANDIFQVLINNSGTEAIQSIALETSSEIDLRLKPHVFKNMVNLKLLKIHHSLELCKLHFPEGLESLPNLRLLLWVGYPLKSLPFAFCPENLVIINMQYSGLEKLWDGVQDLVNLKTIDLGYCEHLIELPDLCKASKLEYITLCHCCSLVEIHESIWSLHQLRRLLLSNCKKLKSLKSDVHLKSLSELELNGCVSLEEFSVISEQMIRLNLKDTAIVELPSSIKFLKKLKYLALDGCKNLKYLPDQLSELRSLRRLDLCDCINLDPSNLCFLRNCSMSLNSSYLDNLGELPKNVSSSFNHFSELSILTLSNCWSLQCISDLPPSISYLKISNCGRLQSIIGLPLSIGLSTVTKCESLKTVTNCASKFNGSETCQRRSYRNCINLDEHAVNSIMECTHYKIKTWLSQLSPDKNKFGVEKIVEVCLPGRKVPDWFRHRASGASTIPLDISTNSICMGFICCVIISGFQSTEAYWNFCPSVKYNIESSDGQSVFDWCGFVIDDKDIEENLQLISDHMLLWYHDVLEMRTHEKRVSLQMEFGKGSDTSNSLIKECGVHPIYASEYLNSDELLHLKKHRNWNFVTESMESKSESSSTRVPIHKTLVPLATETWKNGARGLKQVLGF